MITPPNQGKERFTQLYHEHKNAVFNYIFYRTGFDRYLAEDLTSEIFMKAFEHFDKYDSTRPFKTWIYTIAHNHFVNYLVSKKPLISLDDAREVGKEDISDSELDKKMLADKVLKLVDELPQSQRAIVILRYVNDLSYGEMAKILGKQEGAIRTTLSRALTTLRDTYNLSFSPSTNPQLT